jgi:general secretion pathway protein E
MAIESRLVDSTNLEPVSHGGHSGLPVVTSAQLSEGTPLLGSLSLKYLREIGIYVYENPAGEARAAIADESQLPLVETIAWTLQRQLAAELANPEDITSALASARAHDGSNGQLQEPVQSPDYSETDEDAVDTLRDLASGAPVVRAVNEIIELATGRRATDIHLEPMRNSFRVRIRVDGILTALRTYAKELGRPIVSRVKILAALNIAERRLPQDGRTRVRVDDSEIDIRVATMPTAFGEAAILRLLRRDKGIQAFQDIGLSPRDLEAFQSALRATHGMIVVTGPTGSGKTTTLASALSTLNDTTRKILTIEDPIEYEIEGVNQSQIKPAIGLTFASALRAFLRQDPDVIMVGEMRDAETVRVGIQASLTGHLVLTTLHTNTAAAAITRLIDLQVEPFLLSASVRCIVAQRLVRKLCLHCRQQTRADAAFLAKDPRFHALNVAGERVWEAGKCERCGGTGYNGRRAVFEVLSVDEEIRAMITRSATEEEIERAAKTAGMTTLIEDGIRTALAGETSLEEVLRVTAFR